LPSPFNNIKPQTREAVQDEGLIHVTNSTLVCESCFAEATDGEYDPDQHVLSFVCPEGHINVVKGIEL